MDSPMDSLPPIPEIRAIGVIGSGQMGTGIAEVAALAGFDVRLLDVTQARAGVRYYLLRMSQATFATELDELKNWVEAVRQLPRFLRTPEAKLLIDDLETAGIKTGADLADDASVDELATKLGRTKDALFASLRRCPFGLSL